MTLYINTADNKVICLEIKKDSETVAKSEIEAEYAQAEKLLPAIENLMRTNGLFAPDIKKIIVANYGESFTALRIGVITANALSYALRIPALGFGKNFFEPSTEKKSAGRNSGLAIVRPVYSREPNITKRVERLVQ